MIQVFGTRKCKATKKAEMFFKERGLPFQFVDLADKGISPGELRAVRAAVGDEALLDRAGARYRDRGLAHMDFDLEEEVLADPLILRTPIVRDGKKAVAGEDIAAWKALAGK